MEYRIDPNKRSNGLRLRSGYRRTDLSLLIAQAGLNTRDRAGRSPSWTERGAATVPIFLFVPQVKLPKRLDLARDAVQAHDALPALIERAWLVQSR